MILQAGGSGVLEGFAFGDRITSPSFLGIGKRSPQLVADGWRKSFPSFLGERTSAGRIRSTRENQVNPFVGVIIKLAAIFPFEKRITSNVRFIQSSVNIVMALPCPNREEFGLIGRRLFFEYGRPFFDAFTRLRKGEKSFDRFAHALRNGFAIKWL